MMKSHFEQIQTAFSGSCIRFKGCSELLGEDQSTAWRMFVLHSIFPRCCWLSSAATNTESIFGVLRPRCPHFQSPAPGSTGFTQHSWLQPRACLASLRIAKYLQPRWWPRSFPIKRKCCWQGWILCQAQSKKKKPSRSWKLISCKNKRI